MEGTLMSRYLLVCLCVLFLTPTANAAFTSYTDSAAFLAALGGAPATTLDFDGVPSGSVIPNGGSFDGVRFDFSDPSFDLAVLTGLDTTSPPNFLGVDDGTPGGSFLPEDVVTLVFPTPVFAVGASFLTPAGILDGVLRVVTPSGTTHSGLAPSAIFPSGDEEWFVGLIADTPFGRADLTSSFSALVHNLDDITYAAVPEPFSATLVVSGLAGILGYRLLSIAQAIPAST